MALTEDLVNGHKVRRIAAGTEVSRVFRVTELTDPPETQLLESLNYPGIPTLGDQYPGGYFYYAVSKDAVPAGPDSAIVTLIYSNSSGQTWNQDPPLTGDDGLDVKQTKASVTQKRRTRDSAGTQMLITPPSPDYDGAPAYLSEATVFAPVGEIVFERTEGAPPTARTRGKVGKLNSDLVGSYPVRTLLFAMCDGQSDDGGRTWKVTYIFRYDEDGWQHVDSYHLPSGKVPPGAPVYGFDVLPAVTFSDLGLDWSDSQTPIG